MVATSVARLTVASWTPGVLRRNRSIRFTHEAQVMPSIGRATSNVWLGEAGFDILPRSIAGGRCREAASSLRAHWIDAT